MISDALKGNYTCRMVMSVMTVIMVVIITRSDAAAEKTSFDWVGGGVYVENNSKPGYFVDLLASYGSFPDTIYYINPYGSVRGMEPGYGLGIGARFPVHSESHVLGFNTYVDYTDDHSGLRIGLGAEYFGPYFSNVLNVYLPVSGRHNDEKAIPGFDFYFKVPVPKFSIPIGSYDLKVSFISIWPGVFYYKASDENILGFKLIFMGQPVKAIEFWRGFSSGSPSNDQYKGLEIPAGLTTQLPVKNFKLKEQFGYLVLPYPAVAQDSIKDRPFREHFMGVEKYQEE